MDEFYSVTNNGFGANVSGSAKIAQGYVLAFECSSVNAAIRYFQLFDSSAAPISGAVPKFSFVIAAGSATVPAIRELILSFFGGDGCYFTTGIAWGFSTTQATYTAATAADHNLNLLYT